MGEGVKEGLKDGGKKNTQADFFTKGQVITVRLLLFVGLYLKNL
jgi:hypothetical protein